VISMARADTVTQLSLDKFAKLIGINPLHFNQVFCQDISVPKVCDTPMYQYTWQDADRISREELAYTIANAEDVISKWLGYKLLPTWEVNERVTFSKPAMPELFNVYGVNVRGLWQSVETEWGYVRMGGQQAKALIDNADIVYSDADSDGYKERATVTVATTVTNEDEIAVFYPGKDGEDSWQIRPITVRISAGVATITFRREQCVLEDLLEGLNVDGIEGTTDSNFLAAVDVYHVYNDSSVQARFSWENAPSLCTCGLTTCASCTFSTQYGCLQVRDSRLGLITCQPANWDSVNEAFVSVPFAVCRQPERADIWYRAGWRDERRRNPNIEMDPNLERAVMMLTIAMLDKPLCGCGHLQSLIGYFQEDLTKTYSKGDVAVSYRPSRDRLDNPFGTTRGAIEAWRIIKKGYPSIQ
jgi:hypothetical protein